MRILITGGTGFLGSAFVRLASNHGHTVAVLSRRRPSDRISPARALLGDMENVPWDQVRTFAPEACVHTAWIATPGIYLESPENENWVHWSDAFLRRMIELGVRSVVALGTCIEYQITGGPLLEDVSPTMPISHYARAKHDLHRRLRSAFDAHGAALTWARIFYPYGEGEHPARLISSLIQRFQAGEEVALKTPHSIKDYIHVDDVAAALLLLAEQAFDGTVNIGTGEGVPVEKIARCLAEIFHCPELVSIPEKPSSDPLDFVVADSTRLRACGWQPRVTMASGLCRLAHQSATLPTS